MGTVVRLIALAALATLALGPSVAAAGGVKIIIGGGHPPRDVHKHHVHKHHGHPHGKVLVVPHPVYVAPRRCAVPGHWTYHWVPQTQWYYAWVPGHYNSDALWVEGHYAPRAHPTGYWQPIWVAGGYTYC